MPLKINVGLTQKIGEPNYSSRGGQVQFEVEVEATLVREPEELHKRIRYLFHLAEEALAAQLRPPVPGAAASNGQATPRMATVRQLETVRRLAARWQTPLEELLVEVFDTDRLENLSLREASRLIDILHTGNCNPAQHSRAATTHEQP